MDPTESGDFVDDESEDFSALEDIVDQSRMGDTSGFTQFLTLDSAVDSRQDFIEGFVSHPAMVHFDYEWKPDGARGQYAYQQILLHDQKGRKTGTSRFVNINRDPKKARQYASRESTNPFSGLINAGREYVNRKKPVLERQFEEERVSDDLAVKVTIAKDAACIDIMFQEEGDEPPLVREGYLIVMPEDMATVGNLAEDFRNIAPMVAKKMAAQVFPERFARFADEEDSLFSKEGDQEIIYDSNQGEVPLPYINKGSDVTEDVRPDHEVQEMPNSMQSDDNIMTGEIEVPWRTAAEDGEAYRVGPTKTPIPPEPPKLLEDQEPDQEEVARILGDQDDCDGDYDESEIEEYRAAKEHLDKEDDAGAKSIQEWLDADDERPVGLSDADDPDQTPAWGHAVRARALASSEGAASEVEDFEQWKESDRITPNSSESGLLKPILTYFNEEDKKQFLSQPDDSKGLCQTDVLGDTTKQRIEQSDLDEIKRKASGRQPIKQSDDEKITPDNPVRIPLQSESGDDIYDKTPAQGIESLDKTPLAGYKTLEPAVDEARAETASVADALTPDGRDMSAAEPFIDLESRAASVDPAIPLSEARTKPLGGVGSGPIDHDHRIFEEYWQERFGEYLGDKSIDELVVMPREELISYFANISHDDKKAIEHLENEFERYKQKKRRELRGLGKAHDEKVQELSDERDGYRQEAESLRAEVRAWQGIANSAKRDKTSANERIVVLETAVDELEGKYRTERVQRQEVQDKYDILNQRFERRVEDETQKRSEQGRFWRVVGQIALVGALGGAIGYGLAERQKVQDFKKGYQRVQQERDEAKEAYKKLEGQLKKGSPESGD